MKIPLLDLKRQYQQLKEELAPAVLDCMASGAYIGGEQVAQFESEIASYLGVKHAIGMGNGTDALTVALKAAGIGPGDEVVTTPFTFFASAETIAAVGATPVFADIDLATLNLDPNSVEDKITPKTKALLPVHIFGQPAQMEQLNDIAARHHLLVIEDACQAIGATLHDKHAGAMGDLACFSFFPTKNLGCFGDGGLITTNDDRLNVICRALASHGGGKNGKAARALLDGEAPETRQPQQNDDPMYNPYKYFNYLIGCNSRLDALQAAVLRVKLRHLDDFNRRRAQNAAFYNNRLEGCGAVLPAAAPGATHVWHQYAILHPQKDALIRFLAENGVAAGVFYPVPLHLQKAFTSLGYRPGDLPRAEQACAQSVCLPIFPELAEEELQYVADTVRRFPL